MECPRCGLGQQMDYMGMDDGYGMHGELVCDIWECPMCGHMEAGGCIEYSPRELYGIDEDDEGREYGDYE